VNLRAHFLQGRAKDLPTLLWFADLCEPVANFKSFFLKPENKILNYRNVWLIDHRNFGESDHHKSFGLHEMSDDIVRFMDKEKITMATIGGHGFGAKVATVTAVNNLNRFTGVMALDGGPLDHSHHEAYLELKSYVLAASKLDLAHSDLSAANKYLDQHITCPKWRKIFKQNIESDKNPLQWKMNLNDLAVNMNKFQPDVAIWSHSYGLWPGQTFAHFPAHSRWIHLSTNTLPFYNVYPRLQNQFATASFNIHGTDESPTNHWMHEGSENDVWQLHQRMSRWLRW
jgi:pimeloyl-ACP methyl ester carboxylesterase